eukprot:8883349-Pyramimonas_sp.AAC.1
MGPRSVRGVCPNERGFVCGRTHGGRRWSSLCGHQSFGWCTEMGWETLGTPPSPWELSSQSD